MDLLTYIADIPRRQSLAASLNTSPDYLWQMATGWRGKRPSPELAIQIEQVTGGLVSLAELRSDIREWRRDPITNAVTGYVVPVAQPQREAA